MNIKDFLYHNKIILTLFAISTSFLLYQHSTGFSWDFSVYVLNAKYIFGESLYVDMGASILMPIMLSFFKIFGWPASEYLYIILVSVLYFFACYKFSEKMKFDKTLFYIIALNPIIILIGLKNGTELLSISFLMLFLSYYFENNIKSSVSIVLAFITRYMNIIFFPLILLTKDSNTILKRIFYILIFIIPWLLYSYMISGNPLGILLSGTTTISLMKEYLHDSFRINHILLIGNYLLIFSILGIYEKIKTKKFIYRDKVFLLFFIISFIFFFNLPLKQFRYLINAIIPLMYFSYFYLVKYKKNAIKILSIINVVLLIILFALAPSFSGLEYSGNYKDAAKHILDRNESCMTSSNLWIAMNYYGVPSSPVSDRNLEEHINLGYRVILFKIDSIDSEFMKNETLIYQYPIVFENDYYLILGDVNKCASPKSYVKEL